MGALKELNITSGLRLPQVVVIGNESVGKSSLLENITKCSIFPADHSQCTRTPMRLKLVHVESPAAKKIIVEYQNNVQELRSRDEVLACVTTIMKSIPRSFQSTEIKVTICEVRPIAIIATSCATLFNPCEKQNCSEGPVLVRQQVFMSEVNMAAKALLCA